MEWQNPWAIILGAATIIAWTMSYFGLGKAAQLYVPRALAMKKKWLFRALNYALGLTGILFITYSLSGPREPAGFDKNTMEVSDLYLVFDVSRSMLAEDFEPNRLEAAKSIMIDYLRMNPIARIGVIMFSERVFTLVPITADLKLVESAIGEIDIGFLGSGTNIGDGLALAIGRLAQSDAKSRGVILLTDGVNNVGSMTPIQAAEIARDRGIKIYAIGMGGDDDARIPLPGSYLGRKRYQTIPGGSIDEENLREISEMTGGRHWMATQSDSLRAVFREIDALERSEVESSSRVVYNEKYFVPLLIGAILFILSELVRRYGMKEGL